MNPLFQSTRLRLAVWYTTVTAILLLLFATGVYLYVRHTLIDRIDDTLKHVVEVVDRSLIIQPLATPEGKYRVNMEANFQNPVETVEDDRIDLEWFNAQKELLWSTFSEPLNIPLHTNRSGETVHLTPNYLLRQVTEKIEVKGKVLGYLRVSHPWFEVTKPIRQLTRDLAIGIILMVICVAGIGWLLSGIAIEPIRASYQSLKQFTADASHELRNPIATIQTNVQMALAYPEATPQVQQRQLRAIERLTKRLGTLVNDLLFLARSDSGIGQTDFQPVPLDALLIEVIEEQRVIAEQKEIFLSLRIVEPDHNNAICPEDIFTIQGDWDQLARLFTNLIANAIQHTPNEKSEASVQVELEQIKKSGRERNFYLQVKVKDTGTGIPESDLPYIFDRFYRVDPARTHHEDNSLVTGAGLGLAIASAIVENHQGQITVTSSLNFGTTFTVNLPNVMKESGFRIQNENKGGFSNIHELDANF
jgi:OmpR-family two-component system manganese-sensing sensor histidine kinase